MTNIAKLKDKYIEYYGSLPVQRYAALSIGRNEDTIIRWRKEDADFAERVQMAHAQWALETFKKAKPEFVLERLEKEIFSAKQTMVVEQSNIEYKLDIRTPDGQRISQQVTDYILELTKAKP